MICSCPICSRHHSSLGYLALASSPAVLHSTAMAVVHHRQVRMVLARRLRPDSQGTSRTHGGGARWCNMVQQRRRSWVWTREKSLVTVCLPPPRTTQRMVCAKTKALLLLLLLLLLVSCPPSCLEQSVQVRRCILCRQFSRRHCQNQEIP